MRRLIDVLFLFAAVTSLSGCGERHEWRQKVAVTVETPAGDVSGSAVQAIEWTGGGDRKFVQSGSPIHSKTVGEAPFTDLGGGRYLFALLITGGKTFKGNAADLAPFALCAQGERVPGAVCFSKIARMAVGTKAVLEPDNYPMLVTFDDISDPKTVKLVDPANLAATFGPGFALKSIAIEITDENVTEGKVEKVLGWWNNSGVKISGDTPRKYGEPLYGISKWEFERKAL
jgi:hypothetical protein